MSNNFFNAVFQENLKSQYPIFVATAETVHEMILLLDSQRRLVYFNTRYKIFADKNNLSYEYGIRPGDAFKCINASLGDKFCGQTSFCQYCGAAKSISSAYEDCKTIEECNVVSENGSAFDLRISASNIMLFDMEYTLYCIIDVSSENRKQSLEKIFFHDINNLVGGMSMIAEMISTYSQKNDFESIKEAVPLLSSAMISLNNEIKSNYMLSLAEKDELQIYETQVDLKHVVETVAAFFKETSIDVHINFVIEIKSERTVFFLDENIISRIIMNMTKNAVEASEDGNTVTIGFKHGIKSVIIFVKNQKVMSEEVKSSIFKRSFSTKGKGRGLGTYSMRLLTERYLKGKIYFTSDAVSGTVFYAEIPVRP